MSKFSKEIKRIRTEKGMTCKQVAEAADMKSRQNYEFYERGELQPTIGQAERIAKALGCEFNFTIQ